MGRSSFLFVTLVFRFESSYSAEEIKEHVHITRRFTYQPHMTVGRMTDQRMFEKALDELLGFDDYYETDVSDVSIEVIDAEEQSIIDLVVHLERF